MRRYETIVIIDPDLSEEDRTSLLSRAKEIIPLQEGVFIQEDLWGVKKLAYEIKKKPRGFYALLDYCGTGKAVDELERFFRIDDRAMKYQTVQLEAEADAEKIKAEIEAIKAQKEASARAQTESPRQEASAPVQTEPPQQEASTPVQAESPQQEASTPVQAESPQQEASTPVQAESPQQEASASVQTEPPRQEPVAGNDVKDEGQPTQTNEDGEITPEQ